MPRYDFGSPRLFVDASLTASATVQLDRDQTHYLINVLRRQAGDHVLVFNGKDGEWRASLIPSGKRAASLELLEQTRAQGEPGDLHYLFAPLKHARLDYIVQKAVEMGASLLQPVMTRYSQSERVNVARMQANTIEAAEQCGILHLPRVASPLSLTALLERFEPDRLLVFCDEAAEVKDPVHALAAACAALSSNPTKPSKLAVLIGPEGGFSEEEREAILRLPRVIRLALGPRILRADTAGVAALTLVQAVLGDWV